MFQNRMQFFLVSFMVVFSITFCIILVRSCKFISHNEELLNMGRRTTVEQRELVIHHFKIGKTQRKIAEIVNIPLSTVQHILERFLRENRVKDKGRIAPNKILTPSDERWIIRKINENPRLSAQKLADEVHNGIGKKCSAATIRRVLRSHDFHGRVPLKKPFINKKK